MQGHDEYHLITQDRYLANTQVKFDLQTTGIGFYMHQQ